MASQCLEICSNFRSMLVARLLWLLQRLVNDLCHLPWKFRVPGTRRNGRFVQDRSAGCSGGGSLERPATGGHFVKHDTEREQVATLIERLSRNLLRRHVSHRAHRAATRGEILHG